MAWTIINDIVKLKKHQGKSVNKVEDVNGVEVTDPAKVSEIFNQYFVNVGEKLSNSFPTNDNTRPLLHSQSNSFYLKPIAVHEVSSHIKKMDVSKSVRPGDPSIYFIKISNELISPILTKKFNMCIR